MSKAAIEQSLIGLLPTLSALPPDLIELSLSLLAQSRSKAPNLKADEEIGRTSRQRLGLDTINSRPPCPPRVYKKLYQYLDNALRPPPVTPRKDRTAQIVDNGGPLPSPALRQKGSLTATPLRTPLTSPSKSNLATPLGQRKHAAQKDISADDDVPEFVMPTIRHLCKAFDIQAAAPHVYAGARSVLQLRRSGRELSPKRTQARAAKKRKGEPDVGTAPSAAGAIAEHRIPALLIVLYMYTAARLRDEEISGPNYILWRAQAVEAVRQLAIGADLSDEELIADIEAFLREATSTGWLEMEWYRNIPMDSTREDGVVEQATDVYEEDEERDGQNDVPTRVPKTPLKTRMRDVDGSAGSVGPAGLQAGLGTMFQDKVDWLGEERRRRYAVWRKDIMRKIREIEGEGDTTLVVG
ncbi:hypothetical protein LTR66_002284 [Elasticomyces elasticus]|nr:hypothetical protein LTR28_008510 [Elasticomyces elasticus]KAK4998497.1 hypothetical protein LTR66_002284 [Elasticomyces elasticus]